MAPQPAHAPPLPSATPFAIEASAAVTPGRAQASPSTDPGAHFEAESRQPAAHRPRPAAAAFVPSPTEIPSSARTPAPYAAGLPASVRMPDVQISIGRVEVNAAPARAAPVRTAPARRPPLSLAEYLAQRK
jgi:hypothetical protein